MIPQSNVRDDCVHPLNCRPVDDSPLQLPFYKKEEVPKFLQEKFILTGYRAGYTFKMCLRSIFSIHNETMNIWTHMIGALVFFCFGLSLFLHVLRPVFSHYIVFFIFSLACVACLVCSASFHLFNAHYCQRTCSWFHSLDYFGVTCLTIGSFVPFCYLAFACEPELRLMYLTMIGVLGIAGLVGPFCDFWTKDSFVVTKILVYILMGGSGVIPVIHINFIMPPSSSGPFAVGLSLELLVYFIGLMIYVFKIPERWFPGRFDIWCHSHQIWHMFVLAAVLIHFGTCGGMYLHWETMEFHC